MKRVAAAVAVVASLAFVTATVVTAQVKGTAKGTVAAIGADTVTVKVSGKDLTYKIDEKTGVIAQGAGTSAKEARKVGLKGPKFGELVKVGDEVEVSYRDVAGTSLATDVRVTKKATAK